MNEIPFSKYSGLGNTFLIVDNRSGFFPYESALISALCVEEGEGADGMLFLEHSKKGIAKMRIFNRDGSEAEMCGNGIRCFVKYLNSLGVPTESCKIETYNDLLSCKLKGDLVEVEMPAPILFAEALRLEGVTLTYLDTGVPHAVLFVNELDREKLHPLGKKLREHPHFFPKGSNITFAKILAPSRLQFCTFERGVEGITEACGTGAVAAALALALKEGGPSPITLLTAKEEELLVQFKRVDNRFSFVTMTGEAKLLFSGIAKKKLALV